MNARAVNAAEGVIHAAMQTHQTAAGIAMAVDAAGMLMSPEMASLLEHARQASRSEVLPEDRLAEIRTRMSSARDVAAEATWANGEYEPVRAALGDVPVLLAEVERLRAELADATNLRDHWHSDARASHARIKTLEADRTANVPGLRARITELAERLRTAEAEREDLRVQLAEARALLDTAPRASWWLADYEGADDGPTLHATLDAAKAWVTGWSAGDPYWDWAEHDGTWVQVTCDPDTDRPVGRGAGVVKPALGQQGDVTVYRASHDSIVMGLYTTAAEARAHCVAEERRAQPGGVVALVFDWIEDEEDGVAELITVAEDGETETVTGYVVTALTVAAAYDPDGDE